MKYKTYTNVLNVYSRKYPSPTEATKIQRGVCGGAGGGGGGYDKLSCDWWGSKTKVPLGLDSFWNYTKVIIKDYGLHFDLID